MPGFQPGTQVTHTVLGEGEGRQQGSQRRVKVTPAALKLEVCVSAMSEG